MVHFTGNPQGPSLSFPTGVVVFVCFSGISCGGGGGAPSVLPKVVVVAVVWVPFVFSLLVPLAVPVPIVRSGMFIVVKFPAVAPAPAPFVVVSLVVVSGCSPSFFSFSAAPPSSQKLTFATAS